MHLSAKEIKDKAVELGADVVGIARADKAKNKDKFLGWPKGMPVKWLIWLEIRRIGSIRPNYSPEPYLLSQ